MASPGFQKLASNLSKAKTGAGKGVKVKTRGEKRVLAALDGDGWSEDLDQLLAQSAQTLRTIMVTGLSMSKGGGIKPFAPLSPATLALRRSNLRRKTGGRRMGTKPLISTAQMFRAISATKKGRRNWFIGVPRKKKRKDGKDPVQIALLMESGFVTKWTPKQRRWFWWQISNAGNAFSKKILKGAGGRNSGRQRPKGFSLIIVPPRPFIGPSFEVWKQEMPGQVTAAVRARLGGGV